MLQNGGMWAWQRKVRPKQDWSPAVKTPDPEALTLASGASDGIFWAQKGLKEPALPALYHNTQTSFLAHLYPMPAALLRTPCSPGISAPQCFHTVTLRGLHTETESAWVSWAPAFLSHPSDCWGRKTCLAHWPSHHCLPCHGWLCSRTTSQ